VTRLTDASGNIAEILDFCPRFERTGRTYRPVAFARIVRPVAGTARVRVELNPATGWGSADAERTSGSNHVRYLLPGQPLRLTTDAPVSHVLDARSVPARAAACISSSAPTSRSAAISARRSTPC
jgi:hypothetical protein